MLKELDKNYADAVFELMEQSFPTDEYRNEAEQKALFDKKEYRVYGLTEKDNNEKIVGFIAMWQFDDFAYLENFAVSEHARNGGIGGKMLDELCKALACPVCLEVEPPKSEITRRRIGFYERHGFFLNDYHYIQPALSKGKNSMPLKIMTLGGKVNEAQFEKIKSVLYKNVYNIQFHNNSITVIKKRIR